MKMKYAYPLVVAVTLLGIFFGPRVFAWLALVMLLGFNAFCVTMIFRTVGNFIRTVRGQPIPRRS